MTNALQNMQSTQAYEQYKVLPPLDEQKISTMLKSDTEVKQFLTEQLEIVKADEDYDYDKSADGGFVIDSKAYREFFGQEFLNATAQPQHCSLNTEDVYRELCCAYYPAIFNATYIHKADENPDNSADVRKRKEYIYGHTRRKAQFLQALALSDDVKDENEFWENYAYNTSLYRDKLFYQTIHTKRELPQQDTFVLRLTHYNEWIRHIVDEFIDADYNYNEDLTKGGLVRLYADNREEQYR